MRADARASAAPEPEAEPAAAAWVRAAPLGHVRTVEKLWRAAAEERLPHALLFHGPRGIGKFAAAQWFALGLYCERGVPAAGVSPCLACGPCKRVVSGNHPDVFVIDALAEGRDTIPIGRFVRRPDGPENAEDFLALRAAEGGWRTLLVREMERARDTREAAQNAILKMLEEPGPRVLWILESSQPEALAPTIRSRCVGVRFEALSRAEVESVLTAAGVPEAQARTLARWSRGAPGAARDLLRKGALTARPLLERAIAGELGALEAAGSAGEIEGEFEGRTPSAQARDRARSVLALALAIARDLLRMQAGSDPATLAHGDLAAAQASAPLVKSPQRLAGAIDTLVRARADLDLNLDAAAVLDRAFLALAPRLARDAARRSA